MRMPEKGIEARRFGIGLGVRRNDPCPCGSGLKFKRCCFAVSDPEGDAMAAEAAEREAAHQAELALAQQAQNEALAAFAQQIAGDEVAADEAPDLTIPVTELDVSEATSRVFEALGVNTLHDLAELSPERLLTGMGQLGLGDDSVRHSFDEVHQILAGMGLTMGMVPEHTERA